MKEVWKKILETDQKKIAYVLVFVFAASLLPLLYLSGYVHATGDDYGYGAWPHGIWLQSHSVLKTLKAAAHTVWMYYGSWQGTWFTVFLMALQPEVFSPDGYWIVPGLMLGLTVGSTCLVTFYILVTKLGLPKATWCCVDILLLLSMIQFFPSTKSAIFWWNGAVHYIVPYSLAMLAVYGMLRFGERKRKRDFVLVCLCMFCLGGSSYLAPLFALIVLFYLLVFAGRKKRHYYWLIIPAAIALAGLAVSFCAPGNKRRGGEDFGFHWRLAVGTVINCFVEGSRTIIGYVREYPAVFVCFLLMAMLLTEAFFLQKVDFGFPLPLLFFGLMYGLYCAMFAPGLYAGVEVSGGVPNTVFQVFLLTFLADLVYGIGWISQKRNVQGAWSVGRIRLWFLPVLCIGLACLFWRKGTLKESTAYECLAYISSGQAKDYKEQMQERLTLLLDPSLKEVELPQMNADQGPLMHMEVMEDPNAWTNTVTREFFGKNRVVRVKREED